MKTIILTALLCITTSIAATLLWQAHRGLIPDAEITTRGFARADDVYAAPIDPVVVRDGRRIVFQATVEKTRDCAVYETTPAYVEVYREGVLIGEHALFRADNSMAGTKGNMRRGDKLRTSPLNFDLSAGQDWADSFTVIFTCEPVPPEFHGDPYRPTMVRASWGPFHMPRQNEGAEQDAVLLLAPPA
ncbi:hypothetical protein ATO13_22701 [Stappia sp. 22II-S9-Z10]|nr:hypothetical protein ATO13_22701 [Stappia sp. 22II-S9-Z10]